jgi:GT2 family glycosyltransferase
MGAVAILAVGTVGYVLAARQAVLSLLHHSDFDIHVATDADGLPLLPTSPRVHLNLVEVTSEARADPFMAKFTALRRCLDSCTDDLVMLVDADAVALGPIGEADLLAGLGGRGLAMAEQPGILGSEGGREALRQHYLNCSLAFLLPGETPPERFRFYNSGIVIGRRATWEAFLAWAGSIAVQRPRSATVGEHMIADQDYLQVWANNVEPGRTALLPWSWNHCDKWDADFPKQGARFAHFSNFCSGPEVETIAAMRRLSGVPQARLDPPADARLGIVIVTYNSAGSIGACLDMLAGLGHRVVVVDNASSDDTVAICRSAGAEVVVNDANLGFGAAVNLGVSRLATEAICLLNPDCLLTSAAVTAALTALDGDPESLLVPDMLDWRGNRESGRQAGYTAPRLVADIMAGYGLTRLAGMIYGQEGVSDESWAWPIGACIFMRRSAFLALGGFDARYFCYMEDVQLGREASRSGRIVRSLPVAIPHFGASGSRIDGEHRQQLLNRARLVYARVNHPAAFAIGLGALERCLYHARALRRRLRRLGGAA